MGGLTPLSVAFAAALALVEGFFEPVGSVLAGRRWIRLNAMSRGSFAVSQCFAQVIPLLAALGAMSEDVVGVTDEIVCCDSKSSILCVGISLARQMSQGSARSRALARDF